MAKSGWIVLLMGAVVIAGVVVLLDRVDPFRKGRAAYADALEIGMTEAEVLESLGTPTLEYTADTAPDDYYVSGYARRKRPISGKVLIYVGGEPICYVWLDRNGIVEDYFVGGS